ncbi:MAG: TMEM165/GDT1 family protein [Mycobacteriaceae bacterium]
MLIIATVFALVFLAELPDQTAVAGLVLGTRFPWRWVFTGMVAAFLTHVIIAVDAGSLLTLLPHRPVEAVVAALFVLGAVLVWREGRQGEDENNDDPRDEEPAVEEAAGFWPVAGLGYGVIFVAEWGDLTQILTANLAANYQSRSASAPFSVCGRSDCWRYSAARPCSDCCRSSGSPASRLW